MKPCFEIVVTAVLSEFAVRSISVFDGDGCGIFHDNGEIWFWSCACKILALEDFTSD